MSEPVRKHPRIYVEVPAILSETIEGGIFAAMLTHQLGAGGCMLKGVERVYEGRIVRLSLELNGVKVSPISKVLYSFQEEGLFMTGVSFVSMDPHEEKILAEFVERNMSPS